MPRRIVHLAFAILAALAVLVVFDNLGRPLANPDEGRYAEIAREMAESGDWVTPRLNGFKYFEKPPLQYWATAAAIRLLGPGEVAARLYVALAGLATLAIVGYTGRRLHSGEAGLLAVLALLSSPYFMALGGIVTLDMGLTLWTTAALSALLIAGQAPDPSGRRKWLLAGWAAMALAVLSKGLVGLVIPAAAVALHALVARDWRSLLRLEWARGLPLFLAIAAPWFVAVSLANPEFASFFFIHEHFTRFLSTAHHRVEPAWYFLPILFAGFLPWMFALPAAAAGAWREERRLPGWRPRTFALVAAGFVVAFFSASGSKLPAYILPAFPPLALVLGRYLAEAPPRRLALWVAPVSAVALALAALAWRSPGRAREEWLRALYADAQGWALAGIAVLFVAAIAAALLLARNRRWLGMAVLALGTVVLIECVEEAYEGFSPRQSGQAVAAKMRPWLAPGTRVYSVRHYDQTIPYYIGRTVTLVDYTDEFELGQRMEPGRHLPDLESFREEWLRPGEALAIMHPDTYETFKAQGLPAQRLHEDPRRVLVRKP